MLEKKKIKVFLKLDFVEPEKNRWRERLNVNELRDAAILSS